MKLLKNVYRAFNDYCESDEKTDAIIRNDYWNLAYFSGIYLNLKNNYRLWSVLLVIMNISIAVFEIIIDLRTIAKLVGLNFTLLTYIVQIYLLIQFCVLIVLAFANQRTAYRILHKEMMADFFHYGEDHADILERLKQENIKEKKQLLSLPVLMVIIGLYGVVASPLIDAKYGDLGFNATEASILMDTPIPGNYPFPTTNPTLVFFLIVLQGLNTLFILSTIGSACLTFINIIHYFTMHQKYLLETFKRTESRAKDLFKNTYGHLEFRVKSKFYQDERYQRCYESCLKKCFCHHQHLLRWFDIMNELFSLPMMISYGTGTLVIALSLFSVKTGTSLPGTAITCTLLCFIEVLFMALISIFGQRVADLNEDLRSAMYSIKWYACSSSITTCITIAQEMVQRPMQLNALGLVNLNLDSFANVINSAYSYYNLVMAF